MDRSFYYFLVISFLSLVFFSYSWDTPFEVSETNKKISKKKWPIWSFFWGKSLIFLWVDYIVMEDSRSEQQALSWEETDAGVSVGEMHVGNSSHSSCWYWAWSLRSEMEKTLLWILALCEFKKNSLLF